MNILRRFHYPREQLPQRLNEDDFFINNSDESADSGKHLVALKNSNG